MTVGQPLDIAFCICGGQGAPVPVPYPQAGFRTCLRNFLSVLGPSDRAIGVPCPVAKDGKHDNQPNEASGK
jgi:hypothetical protein